MSAEQVTNNDPSQCPVCGESNQCAMVADPEATECWCKEQNFPRNLLERVPENAVRRRCICRSCVENHREESGE